MLLLAQEDEATQERPLTVHIDRPINEHRSIHKTTKPKAWINSGDFPSF